MLKSRSSKAICCEFRTPFPVTNRCNIRNAAFDGVIHCSSSLKTSVFTDLSVDEDRDELISLEVKARNAFNHVPLDIALYGASSGIREIFLISAPFALTASKPLLPDTLNFNWSCKISIPKLTFHNLYGFAKQWFVAWRKAASIIAHTFNLNEEDGLVKFQLAYDIIMFVSIRIGCDKTFRSWSSSELPISSKLWNNASACSFSVVMMRGCRDGDSRDEDVVDDEDCLDSYSFDDEYLHADRDGGSSCDLLREWSGKYCIVAGFVNKVCRVTDWFSSVPSPDDIRICIDRLSRMITALDNSFIGSVKIDGRILLLFSFSQ